MTLASKPAPQTKPSPHGLSCVCASVRWLQRARVCLEVCDMELFEEHWATMWACFPRPNSLRSCVESRAQNALLLVRPEGAKVAVLRPWRASPTPAAPTNPTLLSGSFLTSSSHGRISTRDAISGSAPHFPWEYTVFPVCCYHLPLCAEEEPGSPDLSPGRTKVIQDPKRHPRVYAPCRGPSQRRPKGRYCAPWIHALHIQDILGCREARTKRELFPLL